MKRRAVVQQDRGAVAYLRTARPGVVALGYAVLDAETPGAALIHDLVMALALRLLQGLAGPNLRALAVSLPHAAPRALAPYRRYPKPLARRPPFDGARS